MAKDPSKTEQATPKRIEKARDEGNVAKSQEISKAISIAAGTFALAVYIPIMYRQIHTVFSQFLGHPHNFEANQATVYGLFIEVTKNLAVLLLPPILFIGLAVWICLRAQVGQLWTTKVFKFKWSRFNPINGLKNMIFSAQSLVRLGKSLLQAIIVGYVPYRVLKGEIDNFLPLFNADVFGITNYMLMLSLKMVCWTLLPMIVLASLDFIYTRWQYFENLKMTKDEVKDERKQSEGDPAIKQKQKQKMMAIMARRMLQNVPKADVVITNPTHLAVALRYDTKEAPAPIVVAKGADYMAEKIKDVARKHNVPIRENVPLARALYKSVEVGDMIPEDLYKAVASILAVIWKMKGKRMGG
ncbi:MAG: flagellar biosynthesis protein FlhB [Deltaproteobacteria bacterium]|jgi:flagellar biosynthetic protein FlhB|nr:flagellar biosynthesis protein FlhB [Deltaproteobacteria bacterium]